MYAVYRTCHVYIHAALLADRPDVIWRPALPPTPKSITAPRDRLPMPMRASEAPRARHGADRVGRRRTAFQKRRGGDGLCEQRDWRVISSWSSSTARGTSRAAVYLLLAATQAIALSPSPTPWTSLSSLVTLAAVLCGDAQTLDSYNLHVLVVRHCLMPKCSAYGASVWENDITTRRLIVDKLLPVCTRPLTGSYNAT